MTKTLRDFYATLAEVQHHSNAETKPRHYSYLLDSLDRLTKKAERKRTVDRDLISQAKELLAKW